MTREAQIVAVADFVAAVAERRPYKEPWDRARIVAALREGSGTHFAPDVVEAAVALLEGHRSMMRRLGGGSPRITPTPRKISHALGGKRRGGSGELVQHRRRVASSSHGQGGSHSRLRLGHPGL